MAPRNSDAEAVGNSIDRRAKPTKNLGTARVAVADSALAKPAPPQLLLRVLLAPLHPRGA